MGIFSPSQNESGALEEFYSRYIGKFMATKSGGNFALEKNDVSSIAAFGGSVSGGYSALEEYGNSLYSDAKEKLIRGIAKDISSMLKVKSNFAETANIKDVVSQLEKIVPDPKTNKGLKNDSKMHKELCLALAKSINKQYGMNIIDHDAEPSVICNKVSEIMYSLFTGLHTEFLSISGDVSRILKNLQVLQEYVDSANKKLISNLEKSTGTTDGETEGIKALYHKLSEEIDRQHAILANLTNSVIGPVGESLITILEDNDDFAQLTTDLKKMTGTPEFGTKLSYLLSGSSGIASAASIVDKALKQIGITVAEYKAVHGLRELREKVYKTMVAKKPSGDDLYKLLVAADLLYKNDMAHDDIVSHLEKKKGGISGGASLDFSDSYADAAEIATGLSNTDGPFKGRTQARHSVIKQISDSQHLRKQLFMTLNTKIKADYEKIKFSLTHVAKKIGGEIELTPELDVFIRQLNAFALSQPDKQNIHMALSGYRTDVSSAFVKYQFMENLYAISESCDALVGHKGGIYFKEIKSSVDSLTRAVEEFNSTFAHTLTDVRVKSLGSHKGGRQIDRYAEKINGGDEDEEEYSGGADMDADNGDDDDQSGGFKMPTRAELFVGINEDEDAEFEGDVKTEEDQIFTMLGGVVEHVSDAEFSHFKTIKRCIREIDYYFRIASVKHNMEVTSGEYASITENYENILGEEAGYVIDQIQKKYNSLISAIDSATPLLEDTDSKKLYVGELLAVAPPAVDIENAQFTLLQDRLYNQLNPLKIGADAATKATIESYEGGYKFLLEYMRSSKIEMLEAAQALDLYLSKFTQSIQFKPDQIKEFVQILEQIEIVAKWFTDKSGDSLVGVFEAFDTTNADFINVGVANIAALANTNAASVRNTLSTSSYAVSEAHYYNDVTTVVPNGAAGAAGVAGAGKFYKPRMMNRDQAINFVKQVEKSIKSVRALENIIATFSRVNTNVSSDVKTFMSSGLMFKAFMKYCVASVISVGYMYHGANNVISAGFAGTALKSIHTKMAVGLRFNNSSIKWTADRYLELCDPLSIYTASTTNSLTQNTDFCDRIFEMSIKSMIAKVFTVVGSYTLFNKPAKDQRVSFSLSNNPLRQILGGAYGGIEHSSIIPEATELYVRLPLLVEWYRTVFEFNGTQDQDGNIQVNPLISMIPDMDSVFGPLCKVIFLDAKNVTDGAYPAEYAHKIIDTITTVYKFYAAKKSGISTKEILTEFVLEINRRYGFIMREEIQAYLNEREADIGVDQAYPGDERVDYDLVDVDASMGRRPAPSDKFRALSKSKTARKYDAMDLLKSAKRFRNSIEANLTLTPLQLGIEDRNIEDSDFRTIANISLNGIIAETKKKINNLKTSDEKYMVIHEQLHGIEKFGDLDQQKMILFHETVVTPLTVLYFLYLALNDFNQFCTSLNPGPSDKVYTPEQLNAFAETLHLLTNNNFKSTGEGNKYKNNLRRQNGAAQNIVSDIVFNTAAYADYIQDADNATRQNMFADLTMETLLRKVMNIGSDMNGLTEVYFVGSTSENTYPVLNYDKLEETCTELFNNAKLAMHQLRKFVPTSIIRKYESIEITTADGTRENRISLFYIQEQLFERLFKNKFGNGLIDANVGMKNIYLTMVKKYPDAVPEKRSFTSVFSKIAFWDTTNDNGINGDDDAISGLTPIDLTTNITEFPKTFNQIFRSGTTYSNISKDESKVMFGTSTPAEKLAKLNRDSLVTVDVAAVANPPIAARTNVYLGTKNLYDLNDAITNQLHTSLGLVCKLNGILYKYCNIFIDKSSKKIYKTLIEKFVNGHNAKDILNGKNINDNIYQLNGAAVAAGLYQADVIVNARVCRTEPRPNAVLFASIANGLKGLLLARSEKLTGSGAAFIEDNFLNVSEYQKELMRANLPVFEKELNLLVKRAEFMKRCLEETQIDVNVSAAVANVANVAIAQPAAPADNAQPAAPADNAQPAAPAAANADAPVAPVVPGVLQGDVATQATQVNKPIAAESNAARKLYLIGMYTDISTTAKSLIRCIIDTQKELNDVPMYFETYNESIIDYNNRNGRLPFMPISNVTHLMNFNSFVTGNEGDINADGNIEFALALIPSTSVGVGSAQYKFTYGTRGLLHYKQEASLKYAPGVEALLDSYNSKLGGAASFNKTTMETITSGVVVLSRFVLDFMYHNQVLDTHNWRGMRSLVLNNQAAISVRNATGIVGNVVQNLTCQTAKAGDTDYPYWGNTSNIILTVENDNFKQSVYRFMSGLNAANTGRISGLERSAYRVYNILDLNIVPVNIHAMQREIPFINLFNYAYTFNHMVKDFIGTANTIAMREFGGEIPPEIVAPAVVGQDDDTYTYIQYNADRTSPETTLLRHVIYPLGLRRIDEYTRNTYRIMSGTTTLGLNRPKYLSDQLWNKVLLNSIYNAPGDLTTPPRYTSNNVVAVVNNFNNDNNEPFITGYSAIADRVSTSLTYLDSAGAVIDAIPFDAAYGQEGFVRYQSKLVRWTEWFVQLQRITRLLMRSQLEWIQDPVVQGSDAISENVTEYGKRNGVFTMGDYE